MAFLHEHRRGQNVDVAAEVKKILLEILDVKEEEIVPTATFIDDLKATSIDLVEIFTAFENAFDVHIDSTEAGRVKTVQDAIDLLQSALAQKGTSS
jgi:acyl carrier protein